MQKPPPLMSDTPSHHDVSGPDSGGRTSPIHSQIIFLSGGAILAILSQFLRAQSYSQTLIGLSIPILILGIIFVIVGFKVEDTSKPSLFFTVIAWPGRKLGIKPHQVMFLILSLTCALVAASAADMGPNLINPLLAVGCWIAGIILGFLSGWMPGIEKRPIPWEALAWAAALMLVAYLLRGIDTNHIPSALTGDEASFGLGAVGFLNGTWNNIFFFNWYSFPALYFLIPAGFIHFLGQTTQALRLPAALAGSLTVAGVYLLGRLLYNHRTGLFGALFLAGLHFHIHFSRLGLNNIWDGLFFVLTAAAFWRAWQTGRRTYFLTTGFLIGLALYFYITAKILPILIVLWVIIFWLNDPPSFKRNWPGLIFMLCMVIAVSAPLAWGYLKNPNDFFAPFNRVLVTNIFAQGDSATFPKLFLMLPLQIVDGFRGYINLATRSWYVSGAPVLRPLQAVLFSLGFITLLINLRDSRTWLLVTWAASIALAGGLSESTPAAQRYVAGAPVVVLIAGFFLAEIGNRIQNIWPHRRWWILGVSSMVVVSAMFSDFIFYFYDYYSLNAGQDINTKIAQHLADYLGQKQGDWQVIFYGEPFMGYNSISSIRYLVPFVKGMDAKKPWGDPTNPRPTAKNVSFVFIRGHEKEVEQAQQTYPGGKLILQTDRVFGMLDWIYELSPFQPEP